MRFIAVFFSDVGRQFLPLDDGEFRKSVGGKLLETLTDWDVVKTGTGDGVLEKKIL